jgi:hypothetical protein
VRIIENPYYGSGGFINSFDPIDIYLENIRLWKYEENGSNANELADTTSLWPAFITINYARFRIDVIAD